MQLAPVRHARIGSKRRLDVDPALQRGAGVAVAAELDRRVHKHRIGRGHVGRQRPGPPAELECPAKVVPRQGQGAGDDGGVGAPRVQSQGGLEHCARACVERGVAGLAHLLQVALRELCVAARILGVRLHGRLERRDARVGRLRSRGNEGGLSDRPGGVRVARAGGREGDERSCERERGDEEKLGGAV